jgi:hypothetical protein
LPQRKGIRQRNKPLVNQHSKNPTPKQDGCRAVLQNLRPIYKFKLPPSLREELTKQLLPKDRRQTGKSPQLPGKTKTEPLLKYQHQNWMLKE